MLKTLSKVCHDNAFLLFVRHKSTKGGINPAVLKKLDDGYAALQKSNSKSLLKKYLTPNLYKTLRTKQTKRFKSTLLDCIQSGLANHDSGCGVYAPDAEAYSVFGDLFNPIIADYHFGFKKTDRHPPKDFGNTCDFGDLDPCTHYIASTRIRCARSVKGYPFNPCMTKKQYDDLEDIVHCTLTHLGKEYKGKYFPLLGMEKSVQKKLIDDHFLFKEGDRFLKAANASRFWPTGRGIYHNFEKTFLVWCNEEDHIRIISMQRGGHFGEVFSRLLRGVNAIEERIPFIRDDRLGYLTFCPTNLGTTIRASVHIRVPKLASNPKKLEEVALKYKLQVRGTRGEHSDAEGGIYDISNKRRMGLTEYEAVKEIYCGIGEIIKLEKAEKGRAKLKKDKPKKGECGLKSCSVKPPGKKAKKAPKKKSKKGAKKPGAAKKKPDPKGAKKAAPKKAAPKKAAPRKAAPKKAGAKKAAPKKVAPKKAAPKKVAPKKAAAKKAPAKKAPPKKVASKKPAPKKTPPKHKPKAGKKPNPKSKKPKGKK